VPLCSDPGTLIAIVSSQLITFQSIFRERTQNEARDSPAKAHLRLRTAPGFWLGSLRPSNDPSSSARWFKAKNLGIACAASNRKNLASISPRGFYLSLFPSSRLRCSILWIASRKKSGISVHPHHSVPRRIWRTTRARTVSGLLSRCRRKYTIAAMEKTARSRPGTSVITNRRIVAQNGTFGCGVDNSRLPQWEQAWALRGFTCSLGQSLMS
jgi:hypothetical protein